MMCAVVKVAALGHVGTQVLIHAAMYNAWRPWRCPR